MIVVTQDLLLNYMIKTDELQCQVHLKDIYISKSICATLVLRPGFLAEKFQEGQRTGVHDSS